jgi:CheY-specific phosphatase CheX
VNKKLNKAIIKATKETFEAVIGHPIKSSSPVDSLSNGGELDTSVLIRFAGKLSGTITLRCSKEMAAGLASNMMGIEIAPGSAGMKDAIGELLNMIMGASTSYMRICDTDFRLSAPATVIGDDSPFDLMETQDTEIAHIPFFYEGNELCMDVILN